MQATGLIDAIAIVRQKLKSTELMAVLIKTPDTG